MSASMTSRADAAAGQAESNREAAKAYFFLTGETGSELLPRVLLPFAKLGLTPYRVHASCEHGAGDEMSVELRFEGVVSDMAELLAARCRSIVGVHSVITVIRS